MLSLISQINSIAKQRQLDLKTVSARMATRGLHPGGSKDGGDALPQRRLVEQVEADILRLKKSLQEEERKLQLVEEQVRQKGGSGKDMDAFFDKNTEQVSDVKWRCRLCAKIFRGAEFVHKHLREKHLGELLDSGAGVGASAPAAKGKSPQQQSDKFF